MQQNAKGIPSRMPCSCDKLFLACDDNIPQSPPTQQAGYHHERIVAAIQRFAYRPKHKGMRWAR